MLMKRPSLMALAAASVLMAEAEAAQSTGSSGEVPSTNTGETATPAKRSPKNPDNKLNIINGRLPLPLVHMIRFQVTGKTTAELAKMFGTSVGKVFDIQKGRNFGYINKDYKPSADEVAQAKAWCETAKTFKGQSLKEAGGDPDAITNMLNGMGVATAEEVAARGWQIRTVGAKKEAGEAAQAPAAAPTASSGASQAAEKPQGAKLF